MDDRETKGSSIVAAVFASTLACSQKRRKLNDEIVLVNGKHVSLGIEEKYSDVALTFFFTRQVILMVVNTVFSTH